MRALVAAVSVLAAVGCAASVVAVAAPERNGLPAYTDGYTSWQRINKKPLSSQGAHSGVKNVYASKKRGAARKFPNGTVIVKSIAAPGAKGLARQVAVMRKVRGRWQWIEYELAGGRYGVLARGALCSSCHMRARANDWVFTKR